ncbi:tripartite tricarboxylate transporter permease [Nesterenkonia halophila]
MDVFADLAGGFANAFDLQYMLYAAIGVTIGTFVGVMPGIGPALALALLLPLTYGFDPTGALIIFAGVYYGSLYGGAITSILLNTPGEAGSVATAIDGHPMAKAGRAGPALATAVMGSFSAAIISTLGLTFLAPLVANLAKSFQATDYFALMVLAFVSVTALVGSSLIRGMISLFIGLFIGLIGLDFLTGQQRFTFGSPELLSGVDIVIVIIGLFAVGEALHGLARLHVTKDDTVEFSGRVWLNKAERKRVWKPWIRGGLLGFTFGSMPTGGSEVPTFLSYTTERRLSKHPEEFGHGAIEGVAGPEAANNASFSGVLVPLLTLGIPTSATAAIILSAFQVYNIQPGPKLFENSPDLVWTLIASLFIGNVMLLVINLPLVKIWIKLLEIPKTLLYAGILVLGILGVYSISGSLIEVMLVCLIGVAGFFMRVYDFPVAPAILGAILGPMVETQLRRALSLSQGDFSVFFTRPSTVVILMIAVLILAVPMVLPKIRRVRKNRVDLDRAGAE